MENFVKTVLPLSDKHTVPDEPPLKLPGLPTQLVDVTLGTKESDCIALDTTAAKEDEDFRFEAMRKRETLEDSGCGDELQELQQILWPVERLRGYSKKEEKFRVDMLFEHTDEETQEVFHVWSRGEVIDVKKSTEKQRMKLL
jgi:hypothetical protein